MRPITSTLEPRGVGRRKLCNRLRRLACWTDPNDIPHEPDPLEEGNQPSGWVKLPPPQPVTSGCRECVVVVVPGLA
jgi:hypothetical protein